MKEKQFAIVFTARNNYSMLDSWMKKNKPPKEYQIISIDEDSTPEQKALGKSICKKHGVEYLDRVERGMQHNMVTASEFRKMYMNKKRGVGVWLLWFQHDCYPKTENFFERLNNYITENEEKLKNFGAIGFNVLHDTDDIKDWNGDETPLRVTARTPLEPGDLYYRYHKYWPNTRVRYDNSFSKPFAVESIMWAAALINMNRLDEFIEPTSDYHFFHAWDDICFQFLNQNVYNICLPNFCVAHEQEMKTEFGLPKSSPNADPETREHYFSKWGHHDVWKERWGFDYNDRKTFESVKHNYKDTLLYEFYNHDPVNGPLRSFDI